MYYKIWFFIILTICNILFCRYTVIENFDDGMVDLESYEDQDINSDDWELSDEITYENSNFSLRLHGNTWKSEVINPIEIDSNTVWRIHLWVEELSEIQGFGIADSSNVLFYSLYGSEGMNIEEWIPVYQGSVPEDSWQSFDLPIADDWYAFFDYLPTIENLIFINDEDDSTNGNVYFDAILDITDERPIPPYVTITYEIERIYKRGRDRYVSIQFQSFITDEDSDEFSFLWNFGDGYSSSEANPSHTFLVEDDHDYSVSLQVSDDTEMEGYATCNVSVDEGETSLPVTMNFVGDVMLARGYENNIIPIYGVESIFEPTLQILGNAADVTIANLECPLTTHTEHHPTKTIYFKGNPENVVGLVYAGIDVVSLANNHTYDYMYEGMLETQQTLDENGVLFSGAGVNSYEAYRPLFVSEKGKTFAFLASSDRTGQYNNYQPYLQAGFSKPGFAYQTPYYVQQQINEVKDIADFVIIESHSGSEYSTEPGENYDKNSFVECTEDEEYSAFIDIPHMWDVEIRHHMIDSGADLVICHHPHIIQGVEIYNGKLIAHSLGNFAFDLSYAETMPTIILKTCIDEQGFYAFEIAPVYIKSYIPTPATGELGLHILEFLAKKSRDMNTIIDVNRNDCIATVVMDTISMETETQNFTTSFSLQQQGDFFISEPVRLVRWGNLHKIESLNTFDNWEYRIGTELIWYGNMEDEGSDMWNLNSEDEWYDETESFTGNRSIHHRRSENAPDNIVTNFRELHKLTEFENYSLHGYAKSQNGSQVTVQIKYYSARNYSYYLSMEDVGISLDGDNAWTYLHKELEIPENARFYDIRISSDIPQQGEAHSWFDDIGLVGWNTWENVEQQPYVSSPNDYYFIQMKSQQNHFFNQLTYQEKNYHYNPTVYSDSEDISKPVIQLFQNYPNPFNPITNIKFALEEDARVDISIFNIKGQIVKTLLNDNITMGTHQIQWNGKNSEDKLVCSGIYFYRLKAKDRKAIVRKCLLLK